MWDKSISQKRGVGREVGREEDLLIIQLQNQFQRDESGTQDIVIVLRTESKNLLVTAIGTKSPLLLSEGLVAGGELNKLGEVEESAEGEDGEDVTD